MESRGKVKNVIKGYRSREDIEQLTIINVATYEALFSGDINGYLKPIDSMKDFKAELDERAVIATDLMNFKKLFIFI